MVIIFLAGVGHVSVQDARLEGGGEHHARLGAGDSLSEGEEQRHVAVDAMLLLELLCSLNPLQVDDSFIRIWSLLTLASLWRWMRRLAQATMASLSKESLV